MPKFTTLEEFLDAIEPPEHRTKLSHTIRWVAATWPGLELAMKWNQPMFLDHGTFIVGFSVFPKNMAVNPELALIERMSDEIAAAGYTMTKGLIRVGWDDPVDQDLLTRIVETQIAEKSDVVGLWRPRS
jgi:uncharacterized protein